MCSVQISDVSVFVQCTRIKFNCVVYSLQVSNNNVFCTVYKHFMFVETWVDLLISPVLKCACGGDTFSKEVWGVDKLVILQLCKFHPYGRIGQILIIGRVSLERVSYQFGYPVKLLFSGKGAKNK